MKQTTLLIGALAIAVIATATPAFAMRDPGAGGGMAMYNYGPQPPRIGQNGLNNQYADGMNLYQYGRSCPITYVDPSGLKVYVIITWALGDGRGKVDPDDYWRGKHAAVLIEKEDGTAEMWELVASSSGKGCLAGAANTARGTDGADRVARYKKNGTVYVAENTYYYDNDYIKAASGQGFWWYDAVFNNCVHYVESVVKDAGGDYPVTQRPNLINSQNNNWRGPRAPKTKDCDELREWVKDTRNLNVSDEKIRARLKEVGLGDGTIDAVMKS